MVKLLIGREIVRGSELQRD